MADGRTTIKDGVVMPFYVREGTLHLDGDHYWPVMASPKDFHHKDGTKGMSMGGPVAYCDTEHNAKELAGILNNTDAEEWAKARILVSRNDGFEVKNYVTAELGKAAWKGVQRDRLTIVAFLYVRTKDWTDNPAYHDQKWTCSDTYTTLG